MRDNGHTPDHPARRAHDLAHATSIQTPSRSSTGCGSSTTSRTSSAAACAICCSAGARRTSTSARRRIRTRSSGLFRNCWIIGRRFRLAHVRFGHEDDRGRDVPSAGLEAERGAGAQQEARRRRGAPSQADAPEPRPATMRRARRIHRDNTFGTPEEDAFRRDFTVNALFYDIATFSIIDYVGGLDDLHARVIRSIGDPNVRFKEDPVRMLRAVVLAARLEFTIDPPVVDAIRAHAPRDRAKRAGAAARGVLQDPARRGVASGRSASSPRSGCSSSIAPELTSDRGQGACGSRWPRWTATAIGSRRCPSR